MDKDDIKKQKMKNAAEWVLTFAAAIALALLIRAFVFEFVVIKQTSMYPTLKPDERVGVVKITHAGKIPERGDIVIIKINEQKNYVKRVIALPGETLYIKDSAVYVNGEKLSEDYIPKDTVYEDFGEITVEEDCVFVMGDNRSVSIDSRSEEVGQINVRQIIGKAAFRLSPWTFFGL